MSWFSELTGFEEQSASQVRANLQLDGNLLQSNVNGRVVNVGTLEISSLDELRDSCRELGSDGEANSVDEWIGDVRSLHADPGNAHAVIQVASQFNLLEMSSPEVTPDEGVAIYEHDWTQGPACAIACGGGTIYRNYFVPCAGQIGQSAKHQIDCLADLGQHLGNDGARYWRMQNGYAFPSKDALASLDKLLQAMNESELDFLRSKIRVGIQWNTQVTLEACSHVVTQVYCSGTPVGYSGLPIALWERFARLILEAAYEATFLAAILNSKRTRNRSLYLTLLGGGVFGNDPRWITDAIERACSKFKNSGLQVRIVSYQRSNPMVKELCRRVGESLK